MFWLYYFCLVAILLAGLFAVILSLPGIWLMILATIAYAALTGWRYIGFWALVFFVLLGIIAEILETSASGAGAKRHGASRRGMVGAIVGGVIGAIVLSFVIPIPVLGTFIGACLGSLLGAMLVELSIGKELQHSLRIGIGAARGRMIGMFWKLGIGSAMVLIIGFAALPIGRRPASAAPTTAAITAPVSRPSSSP